MALQKLRSLATHFTLLLGQGRQRIGQHRQWRRDAGQSRLQHAIDGFIGLMLAQRMPYQSVEAVLRKQVEDVLQEGIKAVGRACVAINLMEQ